MLLITTALFALAVAAGLPLAGMRFQGAVPPKWLSMIHGALAAGALTAFALALALGGGTSIGWGLFGLFCLAAAGGGYMFYLGKKRSDVSRFFVAAHALTALVAFVLLLVWLEAGSFSSS